MDGFSPLAVQALDWYVYLLRDPRTGQVFYIGKGTGNRAFAHEVSAAADVDHPELQSAKATRINQIAAAGQRVKVEILRHGIASSAQAYEVESAAIDLANELSPGTLLNVVLGHHHVQRGLMSATEIEVLYAAEDAPLLHVPVLLVSLNRLWSPQMEDDEETLRDITCRWWLANGPRRDRVQYIFGVHNGVVRSVYRSTAWRTRTRGDRGWEDDHGPKGHRPRWGCDGAPAPEMANYMRTSVRRFLRGNPQWSHRYAGPEST